MGLTMCFSDVDNYLMINVRGEIWDFLDWSICLLITVNYERLQGTDTHKHPVY